MPKEKQKPSHDSEQPRTRPKPPVGRRFTRENAAEMAAKSAEKRREQARSVRQVLADKVAADADAIYASFERAYKADDWRAADGILTQALGRPAQELELSAGSGAVQIVVESCFNLADPDDDEPDDGSAAG